ncbi:hypothetical protein [Psychromonas sp. SP041]|uniref:hypothetical protein n=1 Tax=Psychromonas sp. SP041 TaxID=1365007 RepID=UPI0010C79EC7|nr:hypothetical protein [Psychromonas sp. SP041]
MVTRVIVDNKLYDMPAKEAAKRLGVNYSTLMGRVRNPKEKWSGWKFADVDYDIVINGKCYADIDIAVFELLNIKHKIHKHKMEQSRSEKKTD